MSGLFHFQSMMAFIVILVACPAANAITTWYDDPSQIMNEIHDGRDLEMVDIDSDGDQDIVYTARSDEFGNVVLLVNIGAEEFVPVILDGNFVGATDATLGDLDSDGDIDVVVTGTNRVKWYQNNGGNLFTASTINVNSSQSFAVDLADMNADGEMDVVACSYDNGNIVYFANDGEETFTTNVITDLCEGVTDIDAVDIDEDGDLDVIAAANALDELIWYENDGLLSFTPNVLANSHAQIRGIDTGDFDGDGDLDIGVAVNGADSYLLYENDGYAVFTLVELDISSPGAWDVRMHDIDNDGDEDLFAWANFNHDIYWYEYDVNGLFMEHSIDNDLIGYMGSAVGQINGDDLPDLVGMAVNLMDQHEIFWWSACQNDAWTEHAIDNGIRGASDVQAGDFDLDGDLDLVGAATTGDLIILYENTGNQVFVESELANFAGSYALWVEDMNADGYPDIVCASGEHNDIRLYTNNLDMTFVETTIDGSFEQARSVHVADMDSDGDMDIVGAARAANDIYWYRNLGGNYIGYPIDTEFAGATDAVGVDLNQDGYTDVLACGQIMDELAWYQNDGTQEFTKHVIASGMDGIRSAVAADLDADGDLDVAATMYNAHTVEWWENDGNQQFTNHLLVTNFRNAFDIVAADLSGDGAVDLLISAEEDDSLAWLENDGLGNFVLNLIDGDYERPRGLCVADLNDDGRPDVIASANRESQVQWWENHFAVIPGPLTLTVTPINPPVIVPEDGAFVRFVTSFVRNGPMGTFDAWISITNLATNNGLNTYSFEDIDLEPGTYHYPVNQYIPGVVPGGDYELAVNVGDYPDVIWLSDGFTFHKAGGGGYDAPVFDNVRLWPAKGMIDGQEGVQGPFRKLANAAEIDQHTPIEFALSAAYPNPFNPTTSFAVDLPESSLLQVTVYNINGQQVATLADGLVDAGTHQFTFDASTLTSGLYFIHATVPGEFSQVRKVTLMK